MFLNHSQSKNKILGAGMVQDSSLDIHINKENDIAAHSKKQSTQSLAFNQA